MKNYFKIKYYWIIFISSLILFFSPDIVKAAFTLNTFDQKFYKDKVIGLSLSNSWIKESLIDQESSDSIKLSSILINPDLDQEEYFEITNYGENEFTLLGWRAETISGIYKFSDKILAPHHSIRIYHSESSLRFNNSGGFLKIFDKAGALRDEVEYESSKKREICVVKDKKCQSADKPEVVSKIKTYNSIEEVKSLQSGELVIFCGVVTSPPGTLSNYYFYVQDQNYGIQIYNYWKDFPTLDQGDFVQIEGEVSIFSGERRVKLRSGNQIKKVGKANPVNPEIVSIDDIGRIKEGRFVTVSGKVESKKGDTIKIEQNGKKINFTIRDLTNISTKKIKKGDQVEVSGIVYPDGDFYKILPFESKNVKIIASNGSKKRLPKAGPGSGVIIISFILWNIYQLTRVKLRKLPQRS